MTTMTTMNACMSCEHLDQKALFRKRIHRCSAYPETIPSRIWVGIEDHKEPTEGDSGIQWQLAEGKEPIREAFERRLNAK